MTWFDVFMQLSYPILRIFGEEVEESFWLEDRDDMYERFLPERAEVWDLAFHVCLCPSLDLVVFLNWFFCAGYSFLSQT
jgi:hypothetical protein